MFTDCGSDNPCKNGGNCTRQAFTTICDCSPNYTGEYCEILGMSKNNYTQYNYSVIISPVKLNDKDLLSKCIISFNSTTPLAS